MDPADEHDQLDQKLLRVRQRAIVRQFEWGARVLLAAIGDIRYENGLTRLLWLHTPDEMGNCSQCEMDKEGDRMVWRNCPAVQPIRALIAAAEIG